jgi:hypothetical protein
MSVVMSGNWREGICIIWKRSILRGFQAPYWPSPSSLTMHNLWLFFFFRPFAYIIPAQIGYGFLSMERGLYVFSVHLQEGYETFPQPP